MADKILVAEDDKTFRESLVDYLKYFCEKAELVAAATREEALSIIASTDGITVVVTDLRMPDFGDGEAVAVAAQRKGIKVIVLSGTLEDLSKTVRDSCLAVLDKNTSTGQEVASAINGPLKS